MRFFHKALPRGRASPGRGLYQPHKPGGFLRSPPLPWLPSSPLSPPPLWFSLLPVPHHTPPTPGHQVTVPTPDNKMPRLQGPGARPLKELSWLCILQGCVPFLCCDLDISPSGGGILCLYPDMGSDTAASRARSEKEDGVIPSVVGFELSVPSQAACAGGADGMTLEGSRRDLRSQPDLGSSPILPFTWYVAFTGRFPSLRLSLLGCKVELLS